MEYIHPVISNMISRESCRQFKTDKVSREDIDTMLLAASYAPNAGGRQPWFFSVVSSEEILNLLADEMNKGFQAAMARAKDMPEPKPGEISDKHAGPGFKRGATLHGREGFPPLLIVISEVPEMTPQCASHFAAENIMLAAKACGLDSLYMGALDGTILRPMLESPDCPECIRQLIPEGYNHVCSIGIGYADWDAFRAPRIPRRDDVVKFFE